MEWVDREKSLLHAEPFLKCPFSQTADLGITEITGYEYKITNMIDI